MKHTPHVLRSFNVSHSTPVFGDGYGCTVELLKIKSRSNGQPFFAERLAQLLRDACVTEKTKRPLAAYVEHADYGYSYVGLDAPLPGCTPVDTISQCVDNLLEGCTHVEEWEINFSNLGHGIPMLFVECVFRTNRRNTKLGVCVTYCAYKRGRWGMIMCPEYVTVHVWGEYAFHVSRKGPIAPKSHMSKNGIMLSSGRGDFSSRTHYSNEAMEEVLTGSSTNGMSHFWTSRHGIMIPQHVLDNLRECSETFESDRHNRLLRALRRDADRRRARYDFKKTHTSWVKHRNMKYDKFVVEHDDPNFINRRKNQKSTWEY